MTTAVCWKCGKMKLGAFVPCPKCRAFPEQENDLATSVAFTDHYLDRDSLKQISARIMAGQPVNLSEEDLQQLIEAIRKTGVQSKQVKFKESCERKPWWRKFF